MIVAMLLLGYALGRIHGRRAYVKSWPKRVPLDLRSVNRRKQTYD